VVNAWLNFFDDPMGTLRLTAQTVGKAYGAMFNGALNFGGIIQGIGAMLRGELEEFDTLDEYRMEFVEWLALYKTWTSFDEKYRQLVARQPVALQIKANLEFSYA